MTSSLLLSSSYNIVSRNLGGCKKLYHHQHQRYVECSSSILTLPTTSGSCGNKDFVQSNTRTTITTTRNQQDASNKNTTLPISTVSRRSFTSTTLWQQQKHVEAKPLLRLNKITDISSVRTKIVCTIGPSTDTKQQVGQLLQYGMSVARLNFSHAGSDYTYAEHCVNLIRSAHGIHSTIATPTSTDGETTYTNPPLNVRAVLVDTKGPEIRTGPLPGDEKVLNIHPGQRVELWIQQDIVSNSPIPVSETDVFKLNVDYLSIAKSLSVGNQVLLDDGLIALEVVEIDTTNYEYVITKALNGGPIKMNKGVNLPGVTLDLPALTEKDKRDLKWACSVGADYIAASFIRTPENVRSVIAYLDRCIAEIRENNTNPNTKPPLRPLVISKIESQEGVENFDEILEESDGIMVARGDLGVEIMYSQVFAQQKRMVKACNRVGKPVIVATQMLDSMIRNPRPTRAEVTDVGTAVLDGTDAVMLSGETAAGKYPIESIQAMRSVLFEADAIVDSVAYKGNMDILRQHQWNPKVLNTTTDVLAQELDAVSASACLSARNMGAKCIIVITMSGRVARAVAGHRPTVPVLAFCTDPQVARRLQLHRSVIPIMLQSKLDPGSSLTRMATLRAEAIRTSKELGFTKVGDRVIFVDRTAGKPGDMHEFSHNMKIITVRQV